MSCYGLHWDGPVAWLLQGRGSTNFVGLKGQCPFQSSGGACNHMVPAAAPIPDNYHWNIWLRYMGDPLVRAMLPIPEKRAVFLEDPNDTLGTHIMLLSRLSSPIRPIIRPAWSMNLRDLEKELLASNIQPLVIVQATSRQQNLVDTIGKLVSYAPRPVVISGNDTVVVAPPITRIQSEGLDSSELMTLPLENIGAMILRRYARKEALDGPTRTS